MLINNQAESQLPHQMSLPFVQAMLLNEIGLMYTGSPRFLSAAQREHSASVESISGWNLQPEVDWYALSWEQWASNECRNRLAYAIWV